MCSIYLDLHVLIKNACKKAGIFISCMKYVYNNLEGTRRLGDIPNCPKTPIIRRNYVSLLTGSLGLHHFG